MNFTPNRIRMHVRGRASDCGVSLDGARARTALETPPDGPFKVIEARRLSDLDTVPHDLFKAQTIGTSNDLVFVDITFDGSGLSATVNKDLSDAGMADRYESALQDIKSAAALKSSCPSEQELAELFAIGRNALVTPEMRLYQAFLASDPIRLTIESPDCATRPRELLSVVLVPSLSIRSK